MKVRTSNWITASFLALHSLPCASDDWSNYLGLIQRYYSLDDLSVSHVECRITDVPGIDDIRAQLKQFEKYIGVSENLNEFKVRYERGAGVSVVEPTLIVTISSTEGLSDAQVQSVLKGANLINQGAAEILGATKRLAESTMKRFLLPRRDHYVDLTVIESGNKTVAEYSRGGEKIKEEHDIATIRLYSSTLAGESESIHYLSPLDNRLVISKVVLNGRRGSLKISAESTIQFQKLDKFSFPSTVTEHIRISGSSFLDELNYSVKFDHCTFD